MLMLTAAGSAQPDYIALAIVLALFVTVIVMVLRKRAYNARKAAAPATAEPVVQEEAPKAAAPGTAGTLKIHDVAPKTAAMLMAIVADKMGKPLNELRFLSIKEVK